MATPRPNTHSLSTETNQLKLSRDEMLRLEQGNLESKNIAIPVSNVPTLSNLNNYSFIWPNVLKYFDENEFISLYRLLNKSSWQSSIIIGPGPYVTKAHYTFATTGFFTTKKLITEKQSIKVVSELKSIGKITTDKKQNDFKVQQTIFNDSYLIYSRTYHYNLKMQKENKPLEPALLYKMRDINSPKIVRSFSEETFLQTDEQSTEPNGRVYGPLFHTIPSNLAWVLSHIHIGNKFILSSPLTPDFIKSKGTNNDSALAVEVGAVIKAGYQIANNTYGENNYLILTPPKLSSNEIDLTTLRKLHLKNIEPDHQEIKTAILIINTHLEKIKKTKRQKIPSRQPVLLRQTNLRNGLDKKQITDSRKNFSFFRKKTAITINNLEIKNLSQEINTRLNQIEENLTLSNYKWPAVKSRKKAEANFLRTLLQKIAQENPDLDSIRQCLEKGYEVAGKQTKKLLMPAWGGRSK